MFVWEVIEEYYGDIYNDSVYTNKVYDSEEKARSVFNDKKEDHLSYIKNSGINYTIDNRDDYFSY